MIPCSVSTVNAMLTGATAWMYLILYNHMRAHQTRNTLTKGHDHQFIPSLMSLGRQMMVDLDLPGCMTSRVSNSGLEANQPCVAGHDLVRMCRDMEASRSQRRRPGAPPAPCPHCRKNHRVRHLEVLTPPPHTLHPRHLLLLASTYTMCRAAVRGYWELQGRGS